MAKFWVQNLLRSQNKERVAKVINHGIRHIYSPLLLKKRPSQKMQGVPSGWRDYG